MKLKVCGITQLEQLKQLDEMSVNYAGLIFYPQSARCIVDKLEAGEVKDLPLSLKKIGVFVNAQERFIMKQVEDFGLDVVQLHGDETVGFCKLISGQVTVAKAFRITQNNEQNIDWMLKPTKSIAIFTFSIQIEKMLTEEQEKSLTGIFYVKTILINLFF